VKVILKDDVKTLGERGQVVNVSDGYARNFLFPRKLAVAVTESNMKALETEKKDLDSKHKRTLTIAKQQAENLSKVKVKIKAKCGDKGKLFGSITSQDLADAIKKQAGQDIPKKKISLDTPIKYLGEYKVKARIHPDVTAEICFEVVEEKEA
jgi:large subunit ribosomal protein L9